MVRHTDLAIKLPTGNTKVFLTLAHPIGHLVAPEAITRHFYTTGRDAVMLGADVLPDHLGDFIQSLRHMHNLPGFCVTIPHKQAILPFLDRLTDAATEAGAVNIVRREADGSLTGHQLDGEGFVAGLGNAGYPVAGKAVFLAGAGGAATGIAFALAAAGVSRLAIFNRTREKADALAKRVKTRFPECEICEGSDPQGFDVVINGTSAGLNNNQDLPLDVERISDGAVVAEVIMKPSETPLLVKARGRGLTVHHGHHMLAAQFELMGKFWDGEAPVGSNADQGQL